jgi:hypothetical protein
MMKRIPWLTIVVVLLVFAAPAPAASSVGRFWAGFRGFWGGIFGSVGGVVGTVLLAGAVGLFIITRGKWLK